MSNRLDAAGGGGNGGVPDVLRNINYFNPTMAPPKRMSNRVMRVVSGPGEPMRAVPVNNYGPSSTNIAAAAAQRLNQQREFRGKRQDR